MENQNNKGERVSLISGKTPIILIAPHGYQGDDKNTAFLAEYVAQKLDCFAVINRGWERSEIVDPLLDKADCNKVDHCHQDVVKEEFLDPIFRFVKKALRKNTFVYTFYLHGMSNFHRVKSGIYDLDIVIGFGDDGRRNYSTSLWRKDLFCFLLSQNGFIVAEGSWKSGMSGSDKNNMNQFFVQHYHDSLVHSMQIEIIEQRRRDKEATKKTGDRLAIALWRAIEENNFYTNTTFQTY